MILMKWYVLRMKIITDPVLEVRFELHHGCVSLLMDMLNENSLRSDSEA